MTRITAYGELTAADTETRTIRGRLLPYGEVGRTSAGAVTVTAGTVQLPTDPTTVILNVGHDRDRPVGRCTELSESADGLDAAFTIADVPRGDELLAEARAGLRVGLSVELDRITIRAGQLTAGRLTHVGAVVTPAFPSALLTAADTPTKETHRMTTTTPALTAAEGDTVTEGTTYLAVQPDGTPIGPMILTEAPAATEGGDGAASGEAQAAQAPATGARLSAAQVLSGLPVATTTPREPSLREAMDRMTAAFAQGGERALTAALADITQTGVGGTIGQPQWLGELWNGTPYTRQFVPLVAHGDLTSMTATGYYWSKRPEVDDYSGDKTEIPSNPVKPDAITVTAKRLAGGHDIDRALLDFPGTGFIESYFAAMVESYAVESDARCRDAILEAATANPLDAVDATSLWAKLLRAKIKLGRRYQPGFAIIAPPLWEAMMLETQQTAPVADLLPAIGLTADKILMDDSGKLGPNDVVVGATQAVKFFELPGSPIKVQAENIGKGGRDAALFGYYASIVEAPEAIVLVQGA